MCGETMVRNLHVWVQRVLPLVYDDSLSYYEVLCKVVHKLNEIIEAYNGIETNILEEIESMFKAWETTWGTKINAALAAQDQKIDDAIAAQNAYIETTINNKFVIQDLKVDNKLSDLECKTNTAIAAMEAYVTTQLAALLKLFNSNNDELKCWVNLQLKKLRDEIPEITSVIVESPIEGKQMPIQELIDEFYNVFRYGAITMLEFDTAMITMDEFDALHITKFQFDFYAKKYIRPHKLKHYAYSPYTGRLVPFAQLIYNLYDFHQPNALTCFDWNQNHITCQEYADNDISAYDFDWNGKLILGG